MSDAKEIVQVKELELDAYGGRPEIREMQTRIMAMLPSAKDLGPAGAMALAQASLAMNLNPFTGEIWAIPQGGKNRSGTYDTYTIMVGIKGLRAKAHEQAQADQGLYTVHFRIPREEEIEGLQINKGDIVRACDLTVSGNRARMHYALTNEVPRFTGIGVYRNGERTKMNPLQVARKRAEADAIKQAFDVPLPMVPNAVVDFDDANAQYTDPSYYETHQIEGSAEDAIADVYGDVENTVPPGYAERTAEQSAEVEDAEYTDGADEDEFLAEPEPEAEPHQWTRAEAADLLTWTRNDLVIPDQVALEALGVERVSAYQGTPDQARAAIDQHVGALAAA